MPKISNFIVGILLGSLFAVAFSGLFSNLGQNYDITYDNETIDSLNKFEDLNQEGNETRTFLEGITTQQGSFDIIGDLFSGGYSALKGLGTSLNVGFDVMASGVSSLGLSEPFRNISVLIVIFVIFVGVIMAALLKWSV